MSYGWHCETDDGNLVASTSGNLSGSLHRTNNIAEYEALLAGLQWLVAYKAVSIDTLTILGDSQLVVKTVNHEWKCKKTHLKELRDACLHELRQIDAGHIVLEWIPREQNTEADRLSKLAPAGALS